MPLESLDPKSRPDIRRISVENPVKMEKVEIGIKPGDFESIVDLLHKWEKHNIAQAGKVAALIKSVWPERFDEINISEKFYQDFFTACSEFDLESIEIIGEIRTLMSDKMQLLKEYDDIKQIARNILIEFREEEKFFLMGIYAPKIFTAFPELQSEFEIDDEVFNELSSDEEGLSERNKIIRRARLKTLFPKRASELDLNKKFTKEEERELDKYRQNPNLENGQLPFLKFLLDLKILVADRVEFGKKGMNIIMSEQKGKSEQSLPKQREF